MEVSDDTAQFILSEFHVFGDVAPSSQSQSAYTRTQTHKPDVSSSHSSVCGSRALQGSEYALQMGMVKRYGLLCFAAVCGAQLSTSSLVQPFLALFNESGPAILRLSNLTPQILGSLAEPLSLQVERNSYVYREGADLRLNGKRWTARGANVYWLGLDENVVPPSGQPFYAPTSASYPALGRITEYTLLRTPLMTGSRC